MTWPCPPEVGVWIWGLLPGMVVGYLVRWAQERWRIFWIRHFDHSQGGSDGSTF